MGGGVSPGGAAIGGNMSPQLPRRSWGSRESYTSDGDSGVGAESTTSRYAFGVMERKGLSCLCFYYSFLAFHSLSFPVGALGSLEIRLFYIFSVSSFSPHLVCLDCFGVIVQRF